MQCVNGSRKISESIACRQCSNFYAEKLTRDSMQAEWANMKQLIKLTKQLEQYLTITEEKQTDYDLAPI
jgi:hypothetical protein